jgi:membrane-associated phospholipid phosphatase
MMMNDAGSRVRVLVQAPRGETGLRIIELAQNYRWPDEIYWVMILPLRKGLSVVVWGRHFPSRHRVIMQRFSLGSRIFDHSRCVCRQSSLLLRAGCSSYDIFYRRNEQQRYHFSIALVASNAPLLKGYLRSHCPAKSQHYQNGHLRINYGCRRGEHSLMG